jgi:hypothetical protein
MGSRRDWQRGKYPQECRCENALSRVRCDIAAWRASALGAGRCCRGRTHLGLALRRFLSRGRCPELIQVDSECSGERSRGVGLAAGGLELRAQPGQSPRHVVSGFGHVAHPRSDQDLQESSAMSVHSQDAALNARRPDPGRLVLSELTVRLRLDPSVRMQPRRP